MSLVIASHDLCLLHDTGPGHPERPDRLRAVQRGLQEADLDGAYSWIEASEAPRDLIQRVHPAAVLDHLRERCESGGGSIDADTVVSRRSYDAALRAAGSGLDLIAELDAGRADTGWSVCRPPGHHALASAQMGFCLINNIAVAARFLADRGERVAIVDIDAHHGNGTQAIFYEDPDVLFVSIHQYPWYPFTGRIDEVGTGAGLGTTINLPLPAGATGDVLRLAIESVVAPAVERHDADWLLVSAGFDGHQHDPLTEMAFSSTDYAEATADLLALAPAGRRVLFLEGGYDLRALSDSAGAVASTAVGAVYRPESTTSGGPGRDLVEVARQLHLQS